MRDSKERHVLYIRVVFRRIRDYMVNVVVAFPPPKAESANEISYKYADNGIGLKVVGNAHMTRIMDSENQLVPQHSKEHAAGGVPSPL